MYIKANCSPPANSSSSATRRMKCRGPWLTRMAPIFSSSVRVRPGFRAGAEVDPGLFAPSRVENRPDSRPRAAREHCPHRPKCAAFGHLSCSRCAANIRAATFSFFAARFSMRTFWQERDGIVGYREFSKETPTEEMFTDVDSGPSLLNFGFAASAFGVGAARVQGRLDRAGPLMAEMLVSCVPLVNNTLAVPRILSNATDAPYLGEACILYNLTRQPLHGVTQPCTSTLTPFVYVMCIIYFGGWLFCSLPLLELFRLRRKMAKTKSM